MTCIVVLGMHRSGTSLISSMINKMGVQMGVGGFIPEDQNNPYGYYEDEEILDINKRILREAGGSWHSIITRVDIDSVRKDFNGEMLELINEREHKIRGRSIWGFKDPRTCMTVWLWHRYLVDPKYVVVHRNIPDMVSSLKKAYGDLDWRSITRHYRSHINSFINVGVDVDAHHISYDNLIAGDEYSIASVVGLASFVGNPGKARDALRMVRK